jgi:hypothetical protein
MLSKGGNVKPARAIDLTPAEEQSLQEVLESLLNSGQLAEAERVTHAFGRPSIPVKIITVCIQDGCLLKSSPASCA